MALMIALDGVSYTAGGRDILRDVSLHTDARRIGIVGRNGSGKTTLAHLLAGLTLPTCGRVRIAGVDVGADRKAALHIVGILFQNPDHQIIFPTVAEELAFGLLQQGLGDADAQVAAMLARFDKSHWSGSAVHLLSQGQKQLVCLMAVLLMRPAVIILDEPLSGLDIPTRLQLTRYLAGVDAALVHITHAPEHLEGYDHLIWLDDGRIAAQGPLDQVLPHYLKAMNRAGAGDDLTHLAG